MRAHTLSWIPFASSRSQPPERSDRCIAVVNKICFLFGRRPLETGAGRSGAWLCARMLRALSPPLFAFTFDDPIRSDRRQGDDLINCTICTRPPGPGLWGSDSVNYSRSHVRSVRNGGHVSSSGCCTTSVGGVHHQAIH
jgi:hypothetical protein